MGGVDMTGGDGGGRREWERHGEDDVRVEVGQSEDDVSVRVGQSEDDVTVGEGRSDVEDMEVPREGEE